MSNSGGERVVLGAIKGMLFMRIRELMTGKAVLRSALIFGATFGLLMLLKLGADDHAERFQGILVGVFVLKFIPIYCLTKGGEALRGELKEGTIEYLWVRPASKVELYIGFYLGALLGALSIVGPILLGVSFAGLSIGALDVAGVFALWIVIPLAVAAFSGISGAIGAFSSKFVVLGIFYYGFVELGLGAIPNGVQKIAVSYHLEAMLDGLVLGHGSTDWSSFSWILGIAVFGLVLGATIFSQARYVVGSEKEA